MTLTVNGQKIEDSKIEEEIKRLRPEYEKAFKDMPEDKRQAQLYQWSKENVIERTLIAQQAEKEDFKIPAEEVEKNFADIKNDPAAMKRLYDQLNINEEEQLKKYIELEFKIGKLREKISSGIEEPSEAEINQYYEENKEIFRTPKKIRVSHIVKHPGYQISEAEALEVMNDAKRQLDKGVAFEILAGRYSDCPDKGGDLGYISKGQMVEEFEDVVFNLGPGQVSDVFRTRFGYHIAKVYDTTPSDFQSIDNARSRIVNDIKQQMQEKVIEDYLDKLRAQGKIEEA